MGKKYDTLGQFLVASTLPEGSTFGSGVVDKIAVSKGLVNLAMSDPSKFVSSVTALKEVGDTVATYGGLSVGLDDIAPEYDRRDPVLNKYFTQVKKTKDPKKREQLLLQAQNDLLNITKSHKGVMGIQARSGGRGNVPQLMKAVATPVIAQDWDDNIIPWMVKRSYAEGLRPSELWVTAGEARKNTIMGTTAVVEPGELSKLVVHTMYDQVVSQQDCGTNNGLWYDTCSSHIVDRYVAKPVAGLKRNDLVTPQIADQLCKQKVEGITVRSPVTCESKDGVCSKCYGLNSYGNEAKIGTNLGVQSAHAISEPLTQAMLSSKHAAGVAKDSDKDLSGFYGVQTLMKIPQAFSNAAVLSKVEGQVTEVKEAPQGGTYVVVGITKHYVPPDLRVTVKEGARLERGDALSSGVPKPNEVMQHKGLGVGRKYYTDKLHSVFEDSITSVDKRHFEMLAKAQLSHATVAEDPKGILLRGDVVHYNAIKDRLQEDTEEVDVSKSEGEVLADHYFEFMAGTTVTKSVKEELAKRGVKKLTVTKDAPTLDFLMKPVTHAPLLNPDWMSRLAHQYLSKTVKDASSFGEVANVHGYHPIPAFVHGTEFGAGANGAY